MHRNGRIGWVLLLVLLLAGCPRPLVAPSVPPAEAPRAGLWQGGVPSLSGKIALGARQTQAAMSDIAVGATVALIDTATNNTVSSTVSNDKGQFALTFSAGFVPQSDRTYYLEAFKGLLVDGQPNRAGASAARIRTLISWGPSGWISLTKDAVDISRATTAVSIITSLRTAVQDAPNVLQLMGSVTGLETFTPSGGIQAAEFTTVLGFVDDALSQDIDPLFYVAYDAQSRQYLPQPPGVDILPPNPLKGRVGDPVFIAGTDLGADPQVRFNGVLGTNPARSASGVTVTVPPGATSGPITILVDSLAFNIGNFVVVNWDGRNPFDSQDNVYIASYRTNQIFRITPDGEPSVFAEDARFSNPRGTVLDSAGNVYVSSWSGDRLYKVSAQGVVEEFSTNAGGLMDSPWGLSIGNDGRIYVANYSKNNVLVVPAGGGEPQVYASGIPGASGLAFSPLTGELWVTGRNDGKVYRVPPGATGEPATLVVGGFEYPTGICFDSAGNAYVTNRNKHQIVKISPFGIATPFAPMSWYPESIAIRTNGNLLAGSLRNFMIEYAPNGEILKHLSASVLGFGLAIDKDNHMYVTAGHGHGAKTQSVHKAIYDPVAGKYGLLKPLATNIPNPHSVAVDPDGNVYVGDYSDGIYRIDKGSNVDKGSDSAYPFARGIGSIAGMTFDPQGRLYASAWGNHGIYRFTNGQIDQRFGFAYYFRDMAQGPDGMLYVTDHWQSKIMRVDPATGEMTNFTESGSVRLPHALTFGPDGNLYVGEHGNNRVVKIDMATREVSVYAIDVAAPHGLVFDSEGTLYIADEGHIHRRFANSANNSAPQYVTSVISNARALAVDQDDNLLVADWSAGVIHKVPKNTGNAGIVTYGTGMVTPYRMVVEPGTGDLYVHDYSARRLFRIPSGGGAAVPVAMEDRGHGLGGMVRMADGTFYFTAYDQPRVYRRDSASGNMTLFAQSPVTPSDIVLVDDILYGSDWSTGAVFRIDTQTGGMRVLKDTRVTLAGIAVSPLDQKIYVQPWDGRAKIFDAIETSDAWRDYGTGQYARGQIAFDSAGTLYGTLYDRNDDSSYGNIVQIPAASQAGIPLNVWYQYGYF